MAILSVEEAIKLSEELEDGDLEEVLSALDGQGYHSNSKAGPGFRKFDPSLVVPPLNVRQANLIRAVQDSLQSQTDPLATSESSKKKLDELHEHLVVKRQSINFSAVRSATFEIIKTTAGLTLETTEQPPYTTQPSDVPAFQWDDRPEASQSDRYMPHLAEIFKINGRIESWVDCRKHPKMLSIQGVSIIGLNLSGTTDVAIVSRQAKRLQVPQEGLKVIYELKKEPLTSDNLFQARACLIAANIHSPALKPIMVLSNLDDVWILIWLDNLTLFTHLFASRGVAVAFLQTWIAGTPPDMDEVESELVISRFTKRRRFDLQPAGAETKDVGNLADLVDQLPDDDVKLMRAMELAQVVARCPVLPAWDIPSQRPPPPGLYG